ncbi:MAG: Holliday junction branch migration protein RuvA [Alphaproteobacteria bacterium]|nr:Holliday junction branch migration protein RuvA [Alphaproteobacteria bacterium]
MIGKLTGHLDSIAGHHILVDVGGVGYLVACSAHTLRLTGDKAGTPVSLWIETQVREDAFNLFGFHTLAERDWFRLLITVQGVGAKSALSILGLLSPERLAQVLLSGDKNALTAADGVGPKLALRLITELKDKVTTLSLQTKDKTPFVPYQTPQVAEDALSALLNLGYQRMEAFMAVNAARLELGEQPQLDELIKTALNALGKKEV